MEGDLKIMKIIKELYCPIDINMINEVIRNSLSRSVKGYSRLWVLRFIVSCIDLTTLEGSDTDYKVENLVYKAVNPDEDLPSVAAVCVYPSLVRKAREVLSKIGNKDVKIASVSTYFPSGQVDWSIKEKELMYCLSEGADEVDIVINRKALLQGDYDLVYSEVAKAKEICNKYGAHLKVILETGELPSYEHIRLASLISIFAGADFIKTSTGKITPGATLHAFLVMLYAIRDFYYYTGNKIGIKPAGGIRTSNDAINYTIMLNEILGDLFINPKYYRIGASSLINDVVAEYKRMKKEND